MFTHLLTRSIYHFIFMASAMSISLSGSANFDDWALSDTGDATHFDVSHPLNEIPAAPRNHSRRLSKEHKIPALRVSGDDPVMQTLLGGASSPALLLGFEGVGQGFTGPAGTYTDAYAPPDPNSDVGRNHIVQIVNTDLAIFNKSGTPVLGPVPTNTLWSGFGGGCEANNDGDAVVQYDQLADRWIISQFSVSTAPYLQCVAVSTTGDPTGSYARYSFQYSDFPDYPKLSVWPDGYYITFNMFRGNRFVGSKVCSYNRQAMLVGAAASQVCFQLGTKYAGLLPSDLEGNTPPPVGAQNYLMNVSSSFFNLVGVLNLWKFHVDWVTLANSKLTGPTSISIAAFTPACNGGACIPQSGTSQKLDSLGDRLMNRLTFRMFGDHQSLVVNHSVKASSSVGVRWYEVRSPATTPSVYQQGTFAPDSAYRWMGSVAMDRIGNIGLGYSVSSSGLHPSIRYTGHATTDAKGVMGQGESVLFSGNGSQINGLARWGDYSSMSVDPVDDCTFWYTNQYLATNGSFNWQTRIGSFKLPGCVGLE